MAPGDSQAKKSGLNKAKKPGPLSVSPVMKRKTISDAPIPSSEQGKQKAASLFSNMKGHLSARRQALLSAVQEMHIDETINLMLPKCALSKGPACSNPHKNMAAPTSTARRGNGSSSASQANETTSSNPPMAATTSTARPGNGRSSASQANETASSNPPIVESQPSIKKKGRGPTRGVGLHKLNERVGAKMTIHVDPFYGMPLTVNESSKYSSEIGQIANEYVWPISKVDLKETILPEVLAKLSVNLNITNMGEVEGHIWAKFQSLVRTKRGRLHDNYKACGGGAKARESIPKNVDEDTWKHLCDYWDDILVQAKCKQNALNRSKLKHPHNQGPNAFVPSLHEMKAREKLKGNDDFTKMDFYERTRSKDGKWINNNVKKAHEKMRAKVDESKDTNHPINGNDAFNDVLGTKSSDCASLGHGPPPPAKKATYKELNERYRRLEEQNSLLLHERDDYKEQLTSTNNKMKELEDNHNEQMASSMDRVKELEKKGAFFDNIACQLLKQGTVTLDSDPR